MIGARSAPEEINVLRSQQQPESEIPLGKCRFWRPKRTCEIYGFGFLEAH